jgi:hypothetical protein
MVTPIYKEGFQVALNTPGAGPRDSPISSDGSSAAGESAGAFAGSGDSQLVVLGGRDRLGAAYLFTRGETGWTPTATELPASQYPVSMPFVYDSGFSSSIWAAASPSQLAASKHGAPGAQTDFYLRRSDGLVADIGPVLPRTTSPEGIGQNYFHYQGASEDLSRVLYSLPGGSWPGDSTSGGSSLYEYVDTGNLAPLLVGLSHEGNGSTSLVSDCGTDLGLPSGGTDTNRTAVSAPSGEMVFFTAAACVSGPPVNEIFARVDNGESEAHTVAISEPGKEDCQACDTEMGVLQGASFVGASKDGSKVFFTTSQPLLGEDTTENIYEYDFDAPKGGKVIRVSGGDSTVHNPTAGVLTGETAESGFISGVVGISNEGSHVYFAATGVLTETPNSQGRTAEEGADNLYLFERDPSYPNGRTAFIATLTKADSGVWGDRHGGSSSSVSEDGRFLAFASHAQLTPDDTSILPQAFEYDAQTRKLVRASIGQNGFNDNGNTESSGQGDTPTALLVGDDGAVFFNSATRLTPNALNSYVMEVRENGEPVFAPNVYEYLDGNVYLVSDGQDLSGANLVGIDSSGANVFFSTFDQLVPQDTDTQRDIYDARIDGGFPQPVSPPPCGGDSCQGSLSAAPTLLSPGSEFQAGGNPSFAKVKPAVKRKAKANKRSSKKKRKAKADKKRKKKGRAGR